jgi:hypothetical protein
MHLDHVPGAASDTWDTQPSQNPYISGKAKQETSCQDQPPNPIIGVVLCATLDTPINESVHILIQITSARFRHRLKVVLHRSADSLYPGASAIRDCYWLLAWIS